MNHSESRKSLDILYDRLESLLEDPPGLNKSISMISEKSNTSYMEFNRKGSESNLLNFSVLSLGESFQMNDIPDCREGQKDHDQSFSGFFTNNSPKKSTRK